MPKKTVRMAMETDKALVVNVDRWSRRSAEFRIHHANICVQQLKTYLKGKTSDPFLSDRLFSVLVNRSQCPEALGFKWIDGYYKLVNPEALSL